MYMYVMCIIYCWLDDVWMLETNSFNRVGIWKHVLWCVKFILMFLNKTVISPSDKQLYDFCHYILFYLPLKDSSMQVQYKLSICIALVA